MESTILEFLEEDWFEKEPEAKIDEDLLYTLYCDWCIERSHNAGKKDIFSQILEGGKVKFKRRNCLIQGIRLSKIGTAILRSALQDIVDKPPPDF